MKTWFAGVSGVLVSSDWLLPEFARAILIKLRSKELTNGDARSARKEFEILTASGIRIVSASRASFQKTAGLATQHKHGLQAADALRLAVAMEIGVKSIATLDGLMAAGAERLKISVERI